MQNKGLHQNRFKSNPLEKQFAEKWEELNDHSLLNYLLAEDNKHPSNEVLDRDRVVAATVIQWLGSPIGQVFLREMAVEGD